MRNLSIKAKWTNKAEILAEPFAFCELMVYTLDEDVGKNR